MNEELKDKSRNVCFYFFIMCLASLTTNYTGGKGYGD